MIGLGSRVRYVSGRRADWIGKTAEVTATRTNNRCDVWFDEPWGGEYRNGFDIPLSSLERAVLDWDKPLMSEDGRKFIFNSEGYGRTTEHFEGPNFGREMYYGWLGAWPEDGAWYYEDGTTARPRDCAATQRLIQDTRTMIDPKRPVQTTENPPRECRTIGLLERIEGTVTILLSVPWMNFDSINPARAPQEVEIDLLGNVINGVIGSGLTFKNVPKIDRGFYPLTPKQASPFGRGLISLDMCKSDYPESTHFVEFISVDGVPTEAKIHAR